MGADGKPIRDGHVLVPATFAGITPGTSRRDVRPLLGRPGSEDPSLTSGRSAPTAGRTYGRLAEMAVRMPRRISSGGGGQPGMATSTGMTFDTRPQLA
jgi:hypothetical protein